MLVFSIDENDNKSFMNKLLREDLFDCFEVRGVLVKTFTKFEISCQMDEDYNSGRKSEGEPPRRFCSWSEIRPHVFNIIKGQMKPKMISIVFSAGQDLINDMHSNASALHLNMLFNGKEITFTTATSQKNFSLDKNLDHVWEAYVIDFFKSKEIAMIR